jgi:hypothetical protein
LLEEDDNPELLELLGFFREDAELADEPTAAS